MIYFFYYIIYCFKFLITKQLNPGAIFTLSLNSLDSENLDLSLFFY